jgi:hypothetical protein
MISPQMKVIRTRKTTASATSSRVPSRLRGVVPMDQFTKSSPATLVSSVSILSGATALTKIPDDASSAAIARVTALPSAFAAVLESTGRHH